MSNYFTDRLAQYGINPGASCLWFKWHDLDIDGNTQHAEYFKPHEEGIEILSPDAWGSRPSHIQTRKKKYITRLRVQNPTTDEHGNTAKYRFTHKWNKASAQDVRGKWLFIPPLVYDAVLKSKPLRTLYITEGEFKSFIPSMHGLPIIGIPGIHNFRETSHGKMLEGIKHIITECSVENVVIVYDNDLLDLSSRVGKNEKAADMRPRSFQNAAQHFRKLLIQEDVNVFLSYPTPAKEKVGLDDLFKVSDTETKGEFDDRCDRIVKEMEYTVAQCETGQKLDSEMFTVWNITKHKSYDREKGSSYVILNRIFKLEGPGAFWDYHKTRQLKGFSSFTYAGLIYKIVEGVPVIHERNTEWINPVYQTGNAYFTKGQSDMPAHITNFVLDLKYIIYKNADETLRIATITNTNGETHFIELRKADLVSMQAFMLRLRSWPRFNFLGTAKHLNFLIALWEDDNDVIFARMITKMGWQAKNRLYAYANGIMDEAGEFHAVNNLGLVSKDRQGWMIPTESEIESLSEAGANDKFFRFAVPDNALTLTEWTANIRQLHDTKRDPNGLTAVMYALMCVYSDLIFDIAKFVPMMYLAGIPSSGKNGCAAGVWSLFGTYQPPNSIHSTTGTAFNRICSHFVNACIWLDEWKNDVPKWKQEVVKNSYDRTGKTLGTFTNDDSVKRVQYNSAIMVSGQDIPGHGASDPALANRGVLCQFRVTNRSQEEMDRFDSWKKDYQNAGFTYLMPELMKHRKAMEESIATEYSKVQQELNTALAGRASSARLVQNYTALMTPALILEAAGVIDLGSSRKQIIKMMAAKVVEQEELSASGSEISVFWRILEELFTMKEVPGHEGRDGVREGYEIKIYPTEIRLRLNKIYDKYSRYGTRNNRVVLDEGTLKQYLINHPAYRSTKRSEYFQDGTGTSLVFEREHLPEASNIMTEAELLIVKNKAAGSENGAPPIIKLPPSNMPEAITAGGKAEKAPF